MDRQAADYLRTPRAIRDQCGKLYALAKAGKTPHFSVDTTKLAEAAALVLQVTRAAYPDLNVPYHSRWRHFDAPRLAALQTALAKLPDDERARRGIELVIVSVLLDAGAGMAWRYLDPYSKAQSSKSEGLAMASFDMFLAGAFSATKNDPYRVDAAALAALSPRTIGSGLQVTGTNPLVGVEGRTTLLRQLGLAVVSTPTVFASNGGSPRLGGLYDYLLTQTNQHGELPAAALLAGVLTGLGSIWPSRTSMAGVNLGDVWPHSSLPAANLGRGLVPFHKLSQWLTYSLVESFEMAGKKVVGLDDLTGLPEYRNGGLFIDMGVLTPKDQDAANKAHQPSDEFIVEWRALTVALLDEVASLVRVELGKTAEELPLACVLQGGTWTAGRQLAAAKRADGGPPLQIISDGTVF